MDQAEMFNTTEQRAANGFIKQKNTPQIKRKPKSQLDRQLKEFAGLLLTAYHLTSFALKTRKENSIHMKRYRIMCTSYIVSVATSALCRLLEDKLVEHQATRAPRKAES